MEKTTKINGTDLVSMIALIIRKPYLSLCHIKLQRGYTADLAAHASKYSPADTSPPTAVLQSYDSIILMSQQRSGTPCGLQSLTLSLRLPQLSTTAAAAARAMCAERQF